MFLVANIIFNYLFTLCKLKMHSITKSQNNFFFFFTYSANQTPPLSSPGF